MKSAYFSSSHDLFPLIRSVAIANSQNFITMEVWNIDVGEQSNFHVTLCVTGQRGGLEHVETLQFMD
jgi:hypothetical protein